MVGDWAGVLPRGRGVFSYLAIALVVNALLGCALATLWSRRRPSNSHLSAPAMAEPSPALDCTAELQPAPNMLEGQSAPPPPPDEVPQAWLEMLGEGLQPQSLREAAAQVVRLNVNRYRAELLRIDCTLRSEGPRISSALLECLTTDLRQANQDWLAAQSTTLGHLQLGDLREEVFIRLRAALVEQASRLRAVDFDSSKLLAQIGKLLDGCHHLRDLTHEALVATLRQESRLDALKPALQIDPLTTLRSRPAIEMLLEGWWRADPDRRRVASVALIDLDRLSDINRQYGYAVGDRLIGALARLTLEAIRRNRGYDVASRFSGQQFLVFLGDTGPHGATTAMERLRQTIQAATVFAEGQAIAVSVSCSVTEIWPTDTAVSLLQRIQVTLATAKAAGGNQTAQHEGLAPAGVTPPTFSVVLHTLRLDGDAAQYMGA